MARLAQTDPLRAIVGRVFKESLRFEVSGEKFFAVPQVEWCATGTVDRADLRDLHRYVAGRLRIGSRRFIVFADEGDGPASADGASIAEILTRRELQVALLVAEGKADKEIARHLGISEHTVREHLRRACAKVNISKRSALVAWIMRNPGSA